MDDYCPPGKLPKGLTKEERRKLKKLRKKREKKLKKEGVSVDAGGVFKDIYGNDAKPEISLTGSSQSVKYDDARDLVRWAITEQVISPKWMFLKNKPLVSQVVLALVPRFEPGDLLKFGEVDLPFLTSLPRASARVNNRNGRPTETAVQKLLFCTVPNHQRKEQAGGSSREPPPKTDVHTSSVGNKRKREEQERVYDGADGKGGVDFSQYLLPESLRAELGYPMESTHLATASRGRSDQEEDGEIVDLRDSYTKTPPPSSGDAAQQYRYLGLDCEMCRTENGLELARITVVDHQYKLVYDKIVKPKNKIIDYCTQYSGITCEMLANVTTSLREVRDHLFETKVLTSDTILVGHGLENDLQALRLVHDRVVDTTILFPHFRGLPVKNSLKYLTHKFLNRKIQSGHGVSGGGHDSGEDAIAALELAVLKSSNGPAFGLPHKVGSHLFKVLAENKPDPKLCACVGEMGFVKRHSRGETHAMPCVNNADIASRLKKLVSDTGERRRDFIFARFMYGDEDSRCDCSTMDSILSELQQSMDRSILFIIVLQGQNGGSILLSMGGKEGDGAHRPSPTSAFAQKFRTTKPIRSYSLL